MTTTIQSIHFDADVKLKDFINNKVGKLKNYYESIIDAQVYLKLDKNHSVGNKVVEIKLNVPSTTLLASHQSRTFEEATDFCLESIKRQLVKHKEKEISRA